MLLHRRQPFTRLLVRPSSPSIGSRIAMSLSSETDGKKKSMKAVFTEMWHNYGYVFIGTYIGVYLVTLGSMFAALDMDVFSASTFGLDPASAVHKVRLDSSLPLLSLRYFLGLRYLRISNWQ